MSARDFPGGSRHRTDSAWAALKIRTWSPRQPYHSQWARLEAGHLAVTSSRTASPSLHTCDQGEERGRETDKGRRGAEQAAGASVPGWALPQAPELTRGQLDGVRFSWFTSTNKHTFRIYLQTSMRKAASWQLDCQYLSCEEFPTGIKVENLKTCRHHIPNANSELWA